MNRLLNPVAVPTTSRVKPSLNGTQRQRRAHADDASQNTATAPSYHGRNGAEVKTQRDRAAQRKKLKKKYVIKRGKLVERSD